MKLLASVAIVAALAIRWSHVHASGTNSGVPPTIKNDARSLYEDADDNIDPNTYVVVFEDAVSRKIIMQGIIGNTGTRGADAGTGARVSADADKLKVQLYDDSHTNTNANANANANANTNTNIEIESKSSMEMLDMEVLSFRSEQEMQQWAATNEEHIKNVCPADQNIEDGAYFEQKLCR